MNMADDLVKQLTESIVIETYDDGTELCQEPPELHKKAAARITGLERQLAEAREALKPFITGHRGHEIHPDPDDQITQVYCTVADLRRAARALSGKGET
jgi:hypothetical protein